MPTVINHIELCHVPEEFLLGWAMVNNIPVWRRYNNIKDVVNHYIDPQYRDFLAYPALDDKKMYWLTPETDSPCVALSSWTHSSMNDYNRYRSILSKTLEHYLSVAQNLRQENHADYADLLEGALKHIGETESAIFCLDDKVVVAAWGVVVSNPANTVVFDPWVMKVGVQSYQVTFDLQDKGTTAMKTTFHKLKGSVIEPSLIPVVNANPGLEFTGWDKNPQNSPVTSDMTFVAQYRKVEQQKTMCTVRFFDKTNKMLTHLTVEKGSFLSPSDIPGNGTTVYSWKPNPLQNPILKDVDFHDVNVVSPQPHHHVKFINNEDELLSEIIVPHGTQLKQNQIPIKSDGTTYSWNSNPLGLSIESDVEFKEAKTVVAPPVFWNVRFMDAHGNLLSSCQVPDGECLSPSQIPSIDQNAYKWKKSPLNEPITSNTDFIYKPKRTSFFKRFWAWLTTSSLWKWLLRLAALILLALLILFLMYKCDPCSASPIPYPISSKPWIDTDPNVGRGGIYNPGDPYDIVPTPPEYGNIAPPQQGVLPPIKDDDPIVSEPGQPTIIANRLNILMENEDKDILDLVRDFKQRYPDDKYKVIYYDNVVKRLQIEVPPEERNALKQSIPIDFAPEYELYAFDESCYRGIFQPSDPAWSEEKNSWHLKTIQMEDAWDITKGDPKLTIAIVDNGFHVDHAEFAHRVVMPYNTWTHSSTVTPQPEDHGTHVAGLALAAMNRKGGCGMAPQCAFMPVQVADEKGRMTVTSILDGILYSLYQGADVINVSLGLDIGESLPLPYQEFLQNNAFKEEELLWKEVMKIANRHNAVIVMAAGNENILAGVDPMNRPDDFIVVSAVDKQRGAFTKAGFSNFGQYSNISAPGVEVFSTYGSDGYRLMSGTSMAAPIVTGAVALIKSLDESLTSKEILCILQQTGISVSGNIGNLIQVHDALAAVHEENYAGCRIQKRNRPEVPSTGDVQVLLKWNDYNDLDLICIDPHGHTIDYQHRMASCGGQLEIDMNVSSGDSKHPIENIYWPTGRAPKGKYVVYVNYFKQHELGVTRSPFTVNVHYGATDRAFRSTAVKGLGWQKIVEFTL